MSGCWLQQVFGTSRPVIAMVHLPALPGTPGYDAAGGVEGIVRWAERDLEALQAGGVDAVMFCNENDRPYLLEVDPVVPATMARVIGELRHRIRVPFGVDVLWDPIAALAVAKAVGAAFVREVFTGTYDSDMGLWSQGAGRALRYRRQIGAEEVRLLFNINAEFASPLGARRLEEVARSVAFSSLPDALCVSGPMTGAPPSMEALQAVRAAAGSVPVFANTGVREENLAAIWPYVDGCVVGSALKVDGLTFNPVDPGRVRRFMEAVRSLRADAPAARRA